MVRDNILSVVKAVNNLEDKSEKKGNQKSKEELTAELKEIRQKLKELGDLAGRYIDDMDSVKEDMRAGGQFLNRSRTESFL